MSVAPVFASLLLAVSGAAVLSALMGTVDERRRQQAEEENRQRRRLPPVGLLQLELADALGLGSGSMARIGVTPVG